MKNRIEYFFDAWYQPNVHMTREEWEYIAILALAFSWALPVGFIIGKLIILGL